MAATAPLGKMIVELGLDSTDFGKSLQASKREARYWASDMKASMRAADLAGNTLGKFTARHEGLTNVINAQRKTVDRIKESYDNSFVDGKPTAQTEKLAAQLKNAESQLINYNKQLVNNAGEMAKWKVENEGVTGTLKTFGDTLSKRGKQMADFGDKMTTRVSLPLAAGVGVAVKAAMDWESAFAGVKKTNDEVVDANGNVVYSYQDMEDELRSLAKQLPATHEEIAGVAEAAGQLGIESENVVSFTKTMVDMGEATNMTAADAATSMARLANITNMPQENFDRLGSTIVHLGNNFATTEAEITDMALRLGGIGNQVGMSEADIVALSAAMSSVGINAEAGGTAMTTSIKKIQNAVAEGGDDLEGFAEVAGMSAEDFATAFEEDPARAIQAFVEGLQKASDDGENLNGVLDDLGIKGIRESDTLLRLAGNSELLGEALDQSGGAWEDNSALANEAKTRYETLESQLGMLRNEAKDMAIEFGGPLVEALRDGIDAARPMIEYVAELAQKFSDADPEMQELILKIIGMTVAAGPLLSVTGRLASGFGGATSKAVGLLGALAKKKTVTDFSKVVLNGSDDVLKFGGAAATASGAKGVGAMTGALGGLSSIAWPIVGVGGLLAVGYGAWKVWGEEAYNAGQRTKRWGTDVGEATDDALSEIQGYSRDAIGEFNLLEEGFSTNITSMVSDFESMGQAIENDLTGQVNAFRESIDMLPEEIRSAAQRIVDDAVESRESTLQIVEENNQRVAEIRKRAADNNRESTIAEADIIKSLMQESAEEYLKITIKDADAREQVMNALTGNVEEASQEQAKAWVQSLGEQRQNTKFEYSQQLADFKEYLGSKGILNTEEGQQMVKIFEDAKDASTEALDAQIALIAQKYPELTEEIYFANGQLIDGMGESGSAAIASNERIIENARKLTGQMAANAERNAAVLSWTADEAKRGAKTWNDIVLDEKTGKVKTNVREAVIEAAEESTNWNHIRFQLKNANLDSNAKQIIGEAAIQNGWWDGMSWDEKSAIVDNHFTETVIQGLEDSGRWNEMSLEEKTAIMYSNTPEKITETMAYLGLWDEYQAEIKQLDADNLSLIQTLMSSEGAMNEYNALDPALKRLLAEGPAELTADEARRAMEEYDRMDPALKELLATNSNAVSRVNEAREVVKQYDRLQPNTKHLHATASYDEVLAAERAINRIKSKSVTLTTRYRTVGTQPAPHNSSVTRLGYATGTNYHPGGLAIVNDQQGSKFREMISFPSGETFIPTGRNVMLDLPQGAKVLKASLTSQLFPGIPQYANGVGIPSDATVIQNINRAKEATNGNQSVNINNDFSGLENLLRQMLNVISRQQPKIEMFFENYSDMDAREISEQLAFLTQVQERGG